MILAVASGVIGLLMALSGCARPEETGQPAGTSYWVIVSHHVPKQDGVWLNISVDGHFEALGLGPHLYQGNLTEQDIEQLRQRTSTALIGIYKRDALPPEEEAALSDDDVWYWIEVNRQSAPFEVELSATFDPQVHTKKRSASWCTSTSSSVGTRLPMGVPQVPPRTAGCRGRATSPAPA